LWSIVLLLALDNLGIDVTALVTGLGIGGIAVALAAQNILGDLFASLTIVLDKPFVLKDFLIVNEFLGTVEHIGLKTTRLRSLTGEELVFSNADLLNSRIRNYGRMFERRVVCSLGVVYQTPRDKLVKIPDIIRSAVEAQEKTRFDRAHFKDFGAYALNFEAVYYTSTSSWKRRASSSPTRRRRSTWSVRNPHDRRARTVPTAPRCTRKSRARIVGLSAGATLRRTVCGRAAVRLASVDRNRHHGTAAAVEHPACG
jgi:small-conductance mechanosensitive channel